jgi:hydroxyacylglutathione hydrolase
VSLLLAGLGSYPAYFDRLAEVNRRGPSVLPGALSLPALAYNEVVDLLGAGAYLIDVRPAADFAAGHIPGAISIPLRDQFATWLGWLLPDTVPLVFCANPDQDPADVVWPAYKIGYERLVGQIAAGMDAWRAHGGPVATTPFLTAAAAGTRPYVDVRQAGEHVTDGVARSVHIELSDLASHASDAPPGAIVACGHGERAMTAASLLERAGRTDIAVLDGGPADYVAAHGTDPR